MRLSPALQTLTWPRAFWGALCLLAGLAIIAAAGLPERADFTGTQIDSIRFAPEIGYRAPLFSAPLLGSQSLDLADTAGQVVVINFWATWCAPCREEMPALERIYQRYHDQGLRMIGVNLREDAVTAEVWAQALGLSFDLVLDPDGAIASLYALRGQPTTFIVARDGTITTIALGAVTEPQLEAAVMPLIGVPA